MIDFSTFFGKRVYITTYDNRAIIGLLIGVNREFIMIKRRNKIEEIHRPSILKISDRVFENRATHFWEE
jgi:hypothetical protein